MNFLELKGVKFHKIDKDNDIEIEGGEWYSYISIEETEKLIDFLNIQLAHKKFNFKSE